MLIPENIKKYRITQNISQERLAELCQVSRQSVAKWESGRALPDICNMVRLSQIFNVSLEELIYGKIQSRIHDAKDMPQEDEILDSIIKNALRNSILTLNPDKELDAFLEFICKQLSIGRVIVLEYQPSSHNYSVLYDWCPEGLSSTTMGSGSLSEKTLEPYLNILSGQNSLVVPNISSLERSQPQFYKWLHIYSQNSAILLPINNGTRIVLALNPPALFIQQVNTILKAVVRFIEAMLARKDFMHTPSSANPYHPICNNCFISYCIDLEKKSMYVQNPHCCQIGNCFTDYSEKEMQQLVENHFAQLSLDFHYLLEETLFTSNLSQAELAIFNFPQGKKYMRVSLCPITDETGKVKKVYGTMQELYGPADKAEMTSAIISHNPGGIRISDLTSNPVRHKLNTGLCSMLGYEQQELNELSTEQYSHIIHPDDIKGFQEYLFQLTKTPGTSSHVLRMICKDGHIVKVLDNMNSLKCQDGNVIGYANILMLGEDTPLDRN